MRHGIPVIVLIGIITIIAFYYLFGWKMLLRYMLGAVMFVTFTLSVVLFYLKKWFGKRRVRLR